MLIRESEKKRKTKHVAGGYEQPQTSCMIYEPGT